ncbi:hypothetical protein AB0C27_10385 [Nonomuraea sp. NPDC048882]|uniref:hypothetical protein n=1 Tax=unclassified Nonomuraea TaxID=2593643 RepID=UPI000B284404
MDVRAELLDLKLRVEDLETTMEHGGDLERQVILLHEIAERSMKLQAGLATMQSQIDQAVVEFTEEFAAMGIEVESVRRAMTERPDLIEELRAQLSIEIDKFRKQWRREFDFLRSEAMDMNIKLDRLLKRTPWDA